MFQRNFEFERETKRTYRFKEVEQEGQPVLVGTLYIQQSAFPDGAPTSIRVAVERNNG